MSKLILKPNDRQSIDFSEEERLKSLTDKGSLVHQSDISKFAEKDFSNVTFPSLILGNSSHCVSDRVIEQYLSSDGSTWYRKWASGWKECGMNAVAFDAWSIRTITFPISFNSVKTLNIQVSAQGSAYGDHFTTSNGAIFNVTNNSVSLFSDAYWQRWIYVCGF